MLPRTSLALLCGAVVVAAVGPIPGFRPPAVPIIEYSPLINAFSFADHLNAVSPAQWVNASLDMFSGVTVDGTFDLLYVPVLVTVPTLLQSL